MTESERIVERAQREHKHCIAEWEYLRLEGRAQEIEELAHPLEAHYPPPKVHDWRKPGASNS